MFNFLSFFKVKNYDNPGANDDIRPVEEKKKDFLFKETVASIAPVNWVEKPRDKWRKFPIRNQDGSLSCVAQAEAKELGILYQVNKGEFVDFSASFIYQKRSNKPAGGMWGVDARDIIKKNGATLEALMPSQNMNEAAINAVPEKAYYKDVAKVFSVPSYVMFGTKTSFEEIASTIQTTGKGVMVWFRFDYSEWTNIPFLAPNSTLKVHHAVTAIDAVLYQGKKYLVIDDSWGEQYGFEGQRLISEEFFAERNTFASYLMNFSIIGETDIKPVPSSFTFTRSLKFEETSDDIKELQKILKREGVFPSNISNTGYYGAITAKGVLAFQRKYHVALDAELNALQGRSVGPKTIKTLNKLYGTR